MAEYKYSAKELVFCNEYIKTRDPTHSANKAGYKHPAVVGRQNLNKLKIQVYLEERIKKVDKKQILSLQEVLEGISNIATDGENVGARDRLKAYELLGKTHAAFTDKTVNHTTIENDPIDKIVASIESLKNE